jgi:hypothetical protein
MDAVSRKTPFIVIDRAAVPSTQIPAERLREEADRAEQAAQRRFADAMELAFTGVVLSGALLFGANLLRIIAPAGTLRDDAVACLFALGACGGLLTTVVALSGLCRLAARSVRARG